MSEPWDILSRISNLDLAEGTKSSSVALQSLSEVPSETFRRETAPMFSSATTGLGWMGGFSCCGDGKEEGTNRDETKAPISSTSGTRNEAAGSGLPEVDEATCQHQVNQLVFGVKILAVGSQFNLLWLTQSH